METDIVINLFKLNDMMKMKEFDLLRVLGISISIFGILVIIFGNVTIILDHILILSMIQLEKNSIDSYPGRETLKIMVGKPIFERIY